MYVPFETLTPSERYFAMVQSIVPRPIAWVLTKNGDEGAENNGLNLAPFSFFTGICSDPPLVLFSIGKKPSGDERGAEKDTRKNIRKHKEFVLHIASTDMLQPLNLSAATLNYGDSEIEQQHLETVPFEGFSLPRLKDCKIAMGCSLYRMDEIGNVPQAVIYGEIKTMYINDDVLDVSNPNRLVIDPKKLDPLSRLGSGHYAELGDLLSAIRPE